MRASPLGVDVGEGRGVWFAVLRHCASQRRGRGARLARQQRAGCGGDVGLPHQAFADEEGGDADPCKPREIGRREDAAFADHQAVLRNVRRQRFAGRERRFEGAEVAVVDADHRRTELERAIEFLAIMDFEQHVHAEIERGILDIIAPRHRRARP